MDTSASDDGGFDEEGLEHLLTWVQSGVVSRRQLVDLNAAPHDIRRMLRRGELYPVHRGVYVNHNGPLTWDQRAWAAVLAHWPAALARQSALPNPPEDGPIHIAIDRKRTVQAMPGVIAHRTPDLAGRVQWVRSPPRVSVEHAAIDVAATKTDLLARFRVFADAVQTRLTTAAAIAEVLEQRHAIPDRQLLLELLDDLACGACSVLEREYLLLERRHGLPSSEPDGTHRQLPAQVGGKSAYRDVHYRPYGVMVELDGRPFHDTSLARDQDAGRDLEAQVEDEATTARLTYGLVFRHGCRTVRQVATLLERGGWTGTFKPCPECDVT
jgi:hypothetical protein